MVDTWRHATWHTYLESRHDVEGVVGLELEADGRHHLLEATRQFGRRQVRHDDLRRDGGAGYQPRRRHRRRGTHLEREPTPTVKPDGSMYEDVST